MAKLGPSPAGTQGEQPPSLPPSRPLQSSQEHQEGTNTRGTQFLLFINKGKNKQKKFVEVSFYKFPVFHFYR